MGEVGEKMLAEIREALEGSQPLGFGKKAQPTYVFVRHYKISDETYLWYSRDKTEGQNVPIRERDLTGYLAGVWRFDRGDDTTGEAVPKLNVQIRADKDYVIQTGFTTNFARTLLAGLLGLEQGRGHLKSPSRWSSRTTRAQKHGRPCSAESRGTRMTPTLSRETKPEALSDEIVKRFYFKDPYASEERDGS